MKNSSSRLLTWLLVLAALVGVVYFLFSGSNTPQEEVKLNDKVYTTDWQKGSANGKVTIVEYSDFQCPACRNYQPIVKQLVDEMGQDITFVYRHFPLTSIHMNAKISAQASEAAGLQGKFWEMHDKLFENQQSWAKSSDADEVFVGYAKDLGLDVAKFEADLKSDAVEKAVEADMKSGRSSQVNSTPTFFVNGSSLPNNPRSYEDFRTIVQSLL